MTGIDALAFNMRSAHHLAATAKAHSNWSAWRFLVIEERRLRRRIASGRTDLGGGSPSHSDLPSPAGDLGAPPHGVASPPPTLLHHGGASLPASAAARTIDGVVVPGSRPAAVVDPIEGPRRDITHTNERREAGGSGAAGPAATSSQVSSVTGNPAGASVPDKSDARTGGNRPGVTT